MKSRPAAAAPLQMKRAERRAPAALSLVAHDTLDIAASDDTEAALLDFDDSDVIAGIVPVPPTISPMRDALEQMMHIVFHGDSARLNQWLHTDHPALRGATPFETLVDGDGIAVLRALLRNVKGTRVRRAGGTSGERQERLRLAR